MSNEFQPYDEQSATQQIPAVPHQATGPAPEPPALPATRPQLSNDELARMIQAEAITNSQRKEASTACLLCLFTGLFGGHRFYMGKTGSAVAMLLITMISFPLTLIVIGSLGLFAVAIWCLVDLFQISGWVRTYNEDVRRRAYHSL